MPRLLTLISLVAVFAVPGPAAAKPTPDKPARVAIAKVAVDGKRVTVAGRVALPVNTAVQRKRTRVVLTLTSAGTRKVERFRAVRIDAKGRFRAAKATQLTGRLTVVALVRVAGKRSGKPVRRLINGPQPKTTALIDQPPAPPSPQPPQGKDEDGKGGEECGEDCEAVGTPLVGLFQLAPGHQAVSGQISGSYFRMKGGIDPITPDTGLINGDSPFSSKNYTPLLPGSDGGLRTDAYQPAPNPAFAGVNPDGLPTGDALASAIVQPQRFFGVDFSIVTEPIDLQTGEADPLPEIAHEDGELSGQISAWVAAWNGLWFNQGSPKPDGTLAALPGAFPGSSGQTTPLDGTYDEETGHFTLTWQSLIEGGPFHHFTGIWHLEGTFVPAP